MRVIKNIDGVTFSGSESEIFAALKEAGFGPGKKALSAFLESGDANAEYKGFVVIRETAPVIESDESDAVINRDAAPLADSEIGIIETAPETETAPVIPHNDALAAALATIANLPPEIRAALFPAAPAPSALSGKTESAPRASKKAISDVSPRRSLTPIRKSENGRDSKIYAGLKLLLEGADVAALEAANVSGDVTDFVMRRVTKRGYGIKVSDGIIRLVFPEGVSSIATK